MPALFCMGIHPAPLPIGRGAAIINWKLIEGGGEWGNSLFVMERSTDTGDVLDFEPFVLEPRDDVRTAFLKVDRTALRMLRRTLPKIADGSFVRVRQDPDKATRYRRRRPKDGRVDIEWNPRVILNYVRALTHPYPGAFLETAWGRLVIWRAHASEQNFQFAPGTVIAIRPGEGLQLAVGEGTAVLITLVTPPGDAECWADEWAQEVGLKAGDTLL